MQHAQIVIIVIVEVACQQATILGMWTYSLAILLSRLGHCWREVKEIQKLDQSIFAGGIDGILVASLAVFFFGIAQIYRDSDYQCPGLRCVCFDDVDLAS